jgi:uncharacterized protein YyaL (SSP411 family)
MIISALARGYQVLGEEAWLEAAKKAARFLLSKMLDQKTLYRRWADGERKFYGMADDYAELTQALLDLYESDGETHWLKEAERLSQLCQEQFFDPESGAYFQAPENHDKHLLARFVDAQDNVEPAAASIQSMNLLRLWNLTDKKEYHDQALKALKSLGPSMEKNPRAAGAMLQALGVALKPPQHVIVIGGGEMAKALRAAWAPGRALIQLKAGEKSPLKFAEGFVEKDGKPTAYICKNFACKLPTNNVEEALKQLGD